MNGSEATLDRSILLVDDDPAIVRYLRHGFERRGYKVTSATDGVDAIELLRKQSFDGLVLDLHMSEMDGWSVIQQLKCFPAAPLTILLSGYIDVPATVTAVRAGVYDVVEKPVTIDDLDRRLRMGWQGTQSAGPAPRVEPLRDAADRILGDTQAIRHIRNQVRSVARFPDLSVLIMGETGTGKELVAEAIHKLTHEDEPFASFNCAAIPEALFESELFGHEPGSFTGARGARVGLLESAGSGSVFLDEVGEMPPALQPKLLRALETRRFRRLGGTRDIPLRARVISATNRVLDQSDCEMRSDLYFRLAGFTIFTLPLRDRFADIEPLALHLLHAFAARYPGVPTQLSQAAGELLRQHDWPGNVRELKLVIEHTAVIAGGAVIEAEDLQRAMRQRSSHNPQSGKFPVFNSGEYQSDVRGLRDVERDMIMAAYEGSGHNLSLAARSLGIPRSTLRDKLRKYGCR
ncbi:MAG: sigma-54-dependent transcriptional regulator [Polyangiaceae bacterium]